MIIITWKHTHLLATARTHCLHPSFVNCVTPKHTVLPIRTRPPNMPNEPLMRFLGSTFIQITMFPLLPYLHDR